MDWLKDIDFANPELFWLLSVVPVLIGWYTYKNLKLPTSVTFSNTAQLATSANRVMNVLRHIPFGMRVLAIGFIVFAMARPQSSLSWQNVTAEGIDIVVALDISGSMLAEDFEPNRLEAAKDVAMEFISERKNDRIGLVVYSGESFTQCPLTTDHDILKNLFKSIKHGMIMDGTAIGMGLANAVNRLRESDARSKVVILLTDGENTTGSIPPITAAEIAREFGVRVYTIGVGTRGLAPYPVKTMFGTQRQQMEVRIDEETLTAIADMTGGQYFRATDKKKLEAIYKEINKLEKDKIEVTEVRKKEELFLPWALIGLVLLTLEFLTKQFLFRGLI